MLCSVAFLLYLLYKNVSIIGKIANAIPLDFITIVSLIILKCCSVKGEDFSVAQQSCLLLHFISYQYLSGLGLKCWL